MEQEVRRSEEFFPVVRIYSDARGVTHFEDGRLTLRSAGEIGRLSDAVGPAEVVFRSTGADYDYDWHPTPARQFVVVVTGAIEIEVGDGERRVIEAGTTLFLEDTEGPGHRTRNVGAVPRYSIFIQTDGVVPYRATPQSTTAGDDV